MADGVAMRRWQVGGLAAPLYLQSGAPYRRLAFAQRGILDSRIDDGVDLRAQQMLPWGSTWWVGN